MNPLMNPLIVYSMRCHRIMTNNPHKFPEPKVRSSDSLLPPYLVNSDIKQAARDWNKASIWHFA